MPNGETAHVLPPNEDPLATFIKEHDNHVDYNVALSVAEASYLATLRVDDRHFQARPDHQVLQSITWRLEHSTGILDVESTFEVDDIRHMMHFPLHWPLRKAYLKASATGFARMTLASRGKGVVIRRLYKEQGSDTAPQRASLEIPYEMALLAGGWDLKTHQKQPADSPRNFRDPANLRQFRLLRPGCPEIECWLNQQLSVYETEQKPCYSLSTVTRFYRSFGVKLKHPDLELAKWRQKLEVDESMPTVRVISGFWHFLGKKTATEAFMAKRREKQELALLGRLTGCEPHREGPATSMQKEIKRDDFANQAVSRAFCKPESAPTPGKAPDQSGHHY